MLGLTTVVLAVFDHTSLDLYFAVFLSEYLALTILFAAPHQRALRLFNTMGYILFTGLLAILVFKALQLVLPATQSGGR